ncbi:uncharacterized protein M421DRAFT_324095 [Didymella exigua CBS 183.55]|uniref:Uncharacterized protein n=1 Tax=Didymella exigua CBS 183.55 TaxID=1150837 RepID=A0A6A5RWL9_9PLEO|nr:uncharacterized protein M421DRAFT_324095 [Didymella exigua CBS 183.55]KAF1931959.1 hypothetical protein M421DRAFT_324095 [Didymella exigua CBS 183.55]
MAGGLGVCSVAATGVESGEGRRSGRLSKVAAPRQQASGQQRTRLVSASALEPIVLETSERLQKASAPARYEGSQALWVWRWRHIRQCPCSL